MATTTMTVASFFDATTFTGARHARPLIDALTAHDMPPRVLISGNAGSGKTTMLRGAQRFLTQKHADVSVLGPETDVLDVPASSILLADDLHLLPSAQMEGLRARASNPEAALVVTSRPWPHSHALSSIARHLERSRPAVVLGHLTRADVLDYLEANERTLKPACLDHLLEVTGGVAWLVSAALAAHDDRDCADDGAHAALGHVLEQSVAHRLGVVEEEVRRTIEAMSVWSDDAPVLTDPLDDVESVIAQGYAEGLLLRNGRPVPVVRSAVRANLSARRLVDLITAMPGGIDPLASRPGDWLGDLRDPRLSSALVEHGDQLLDSDPVRAGELYGAAAEAGVSSADLAAKRAQAAWSCGDVDSAAQLLDEAMTFADRSESVSARIADVAAATWSMRGMLHTGAGFYDVFPPTTAEASVRRLIARIGVGEADATGPEDESTPE
ncbi:MAG TPA: ATP-binding protein, partial [Microbacterium sp.]|nr:ATP-binding protein [Microbacterium sp.]